MIKELKHISLCLFCLFLVMLPHIINPFYYFNSDFALTGLISNAILNGSHPVYIAVHYNGALESYLTAILFFIFSPSIHVLNLVPILFSLGFILVFYLFLKLYYDLNIAFYATLIAAFFPLNIATRSFYSHPNIIEISFFGILMFVLYKSRLNSILKALIIPLIAGVGLWTNLTMAFFILALCCFVVLDSFKFSYKIILHSTICIFTFLLGYLPAIIYLKTTTVLDKQSFAFKDPWGLIKNFKTLHKIIKYTYFDLKSESYFVLFISAIGVVVFHIGVIYFLYRLYKCLKTRKPDPLVMIVCVQIAMWVSNARVVDTGHERHIQFFYFAILTFVIILLTKIKKYRLVLIPIFILPFVVNSLYANYSLLTKTETRSYIKEAPYIKSLDVKGGISEYYWLCYDLDFYINEEVKIAYIDDYPISFTNITKYKDFVKDLDEIVFISDKKYTATITAWDQKYDILIEYKTYNEVDKLELFIYKLKKTVDQQNAKNY